MLNGAKIWGYSKKLKGVEQTKLRALQMFFGVGRLHQAAVYVVLGQGSGTGPFLFYQDLDLQRVAKHFRWKGLASYWLTSKWRTNRQKLYIIDALVHGMVLDQIYI